MAIRFGNGFVIGTTGGGGGTNPYGYGVWKLNMSVAESNTTGIIFAAQSFSSNNGPGYASGWTDVAHVLNGGANFWEYGYFSYTQFTTPQTNLAVEGTIQFDALDNPEAKGLTIVGDALVGDSSSPTLWDSFTVQESSTNSTLISISAPNNSVIVIALGVESGQNNSVARNITSVSGLGLTWSLRKRYKDPNSVCGQQVELWYAINDSGNSVSGDVNITYDNNFDDQITIATVWEGCNLSNPWTSTPTSTSNSNVVAPGPTPTATPIPPTPTPSATSAPLTQFLPNGSIGPNGLITWLDYTTGINASNNIIDLSTFNNEFTYSGSNPWSNGVTGYTFTGNGSYASATSTTQYNQILNSFTIEIWVKIPSIPATMSLLAAGGNNSGGWALRMDNSGTALNFVKYNVSDQTVYLNSQFQSNTWYHIVVAQGGTSLTYMINGEIVGASNSGANNNLSIPNGTVNISKDFYTGTNEGLVLGSLKVYDYCRISTDITDDFNSSKGGYGFVVPTATPTSTELSPTGTSEPTPTGTSEPTPTPSSTPNHGFQYTLIDRTNITGPFGTEFSLACEGLTCLGEETCTISGSSNHYFDNENISVGDYSYIGANSNVVASITDGYYILSDGGLIAPYIFEFVSNQVASILTCPSPTNPPTATATQVLPTGTPGPTPTSTPVMSTLEIQVPTGTPYIRFNNVTYNSTTTISVVQDQLYEIYTANADGNFWYWSGTNVNLPSSNAQYTYAAVTGSTGTLQVNYHVVPTGTSTPTPTNTPTPTSTPAPSGTPSPTSAPTGTPAPTGTSTPMPTSTSAPNPTPTATSASAPMTVTIYESGSNVVMSASGTVDLSGLTLVSSSVGPFGGGGLGINNATFVCGANGSSGTSYSGFTSVPSNFGSGSGLANSSGTGQAFGIIYDMAPPHLLIVPTGYTSGTNISSTQTFNNKTLSSLGLTIGTYTYTWSGGSIDVVVSGTPGPTGTPAPTSSGAGWNFYEASGNNVTMPPLSDGQALFYTNVGGPPISTYNPNNGVAQFVMLYKKDSVGTDYTTQFTNLQTNGGTINVTQNGNTATYVGGSGVFFLDPQGFFLIPTGIQTVTAASSFTYSDTITITFS